MEHFETIAGVFLALLGMNNTQNKPTLEKLVSQMTQKYSLKCMYFLKFYL